MTNFPEVGKQIWTHMKNIQSLELCIDADSPSNKFPAIDSCITGISHDDCTRLYDLIQTDKSIILTKGKSHEKNNSESNLPQIERENPSILDLKGKTTF